MSEGNAVRCGVAIGLAYNTHVRLIYSLNCNKNADLKRESLFSMIDVAAAYFLRLSSYKVYTNKLKYILLSSYIS